MSTKIPQPRVYQPGADITGVATGDIVSRTFVAISGDRGASGNASVVTASSGGRIFGVAANAAATGELVHVARDGVVRVLAGGDITAGAEVEVGADGKATAKASGVAIGFVITGVSSGGVAEIALY